MPKETFFNLDEDKQKRILSAAKEEFSRVPMPDASISNIIKIAAIPRGSFYQYFENKEDLYFYCFDNIRKDQTKIFISELEMNHGDIVKTMKEFFSNNIFDTVSGDNAKFFENIFMKMDFRMTDRTHPRTGPHAHPHQHGFKKTDHQISEKVDYSLLNISTEEELNLLIFSMMSPFMKTISHYFSSKKKGIDISVSDLQKEYEMMANWVAVGVSKREGKNK